MDNEPIGGVYLQFFFVFPTTWDDDPQVLPFSNHRMVNLYVGILDRRPFRSPSFEDPNFFQRAL